MTFFPLFGFIPDRRIVVNDAAQNDPTGNGRFVFQSGLEINSTGRRHSRFGFNSMAASI